MNDAAPNAVAVASAVGSGPHRMTVGLKPLREAEWIDDGDDYGAQLHERARLLREHHAEVVAAVPGCAESQAEVLDLLVRHLGAYRAVDYRLDGRALYVRPLGETVDLDRCPDRPFDIAARIVPEDLCLMRADEDGRYRLVAAALCFPTRWRLADKLGQPMLGIHTPVPDYAEAIGSAVDRFMAALKTEHPVWRHNWSLLDAPTLFQPSRPSVAPLDALRLGETLWLRSERQTLRRLATSSDVLFTIRIRQVTLGQACNVPGLRQRLAMQIASMPADLLDYKGLSNLAPALLRFLT